MQQDLIGAMMSARKHARKQCGAKTMIAVYKDMKTVYREMQLHTVSAELCVFFEYRIVM